MRFSSVFPVKFASDDPSDSERERASAQQSPWQGGAPASAPWPPNEPPDDLDQRVRQVGEW